MPPGETAGLIDRRVPVWTLARPRFRARQIALASLGLLLTASAAATLAACAFALIIPQQLDEGEPLIFGLAGRLLHGQPLYQPIDQQPFVQVHYTPLYYALVAVMRQMIGHGFAPGRLVSLAAGVCTATLLAYLSAARLRSWWAGAFAVVMFLGLAFPGGPAPFLVLERVDMLGVFFSVAAVAVLSVAAGNRFVVAAAILAGLALLTKQSLFAAALAGTIWLATREWRAAGLFALTTLFIVLVPSAFLEWASGGAYWHNIGPDNPSPTALPFGAYLFRELIVIQGVPTLLAGMYVITARAWKSTLGRLLMLYWLATTLSIVGIIKVGANHNYWIELAAANAVLATLGLWSAMQTPRQTVRTVLSTVGIGVFAVQLSALVPARFILDRPYDVVPESWTLNVPQFAALVKDRAQFHEFFDQLHDEPEPVLAESMDSAVLTDHPVNFEPFAFSMLEQEGRWSSQPLVDDICAGRIPSLVLSHPIEMDLHPVGLVEFPMWPRTVMAALRKSMVLEDARAGHWLYRPRSERDAATVAECKTIAAAAVSSR